MAGREYSHSLWYSSNKLSPDSWVYLGVVWGQFLKPIQNVNVLVVLGEFIDPSHKFMSKQLEMKDLIWFVVSNVCLWPLSPLILGQQFGMNIEMVGVCGKGGIDRKQRKHWRSSITLKGVSTSPGVYFLQLGPICQNLSNFPSDIAFTKGPSTPHRSRVKAIF